MTIHLWQAILMACCLCLLFGLTYVKGMGDAARTLYKAIEKVGGSQLAHQVYHALSEDK